MDHHMFYRKVLLQFQELRLGIQSGISTDLKRMEFYRIRMKWMLMGKPDGTPYFNDQRPGDVRFVDQNQDGLIDEDDKVYLGNPNPDFEMGFQLNLEYKGVYLNTTLTGKFGMQVMQSYRSFADNFTQNYTSGVFDRWHGEGTSTKMPRLTYGSNRNQQFISDIYMHDADYVRVSNLTIGYDFSKMKLILRMPFQI
jgi:TonB-dependent starch-binding outer membrane protein SusC